MSNDAAGFACAADRSVAPPEGLSTLGSDPARFQARPPACYRAPWRLPGPDFHRQATTSFRSGHDRWTITSVISGRTGWSTRPYRGTGQRTPDGAIKAGEVVADAPMATIAATVVPVVVAQIRTIFTRTQE